MHYEHVDIGTSNFDYSISGSNSNVLLVEPILFYLDSIPEEPNQIKANFAISDYNGTGLIHYVDPDDINKYNLPNYWCGCNSLNHPHIVVNNQLKEKELIDISKVVQVNVITFFELVKMYNITSIDYLKIDTEGHDHVILTQVLEIVEQGLPIKEIKFEYFRADYFNNKTQLDDILLKFSPLNYSWGLEKTFDNMILKRI